MKDKDRKKYLLALTIIGLALQLVGSYLIIMNGPIMLFIGIFIFVWGYGIAIINRIEKIL